MFQSIALPAALSDASVIRTAVYSDTPAPNGCVTRERCVTLQEFTEQVKRTLQSFQITDGRDCFSAYDAAESVFVSPDLTTPQMANLLDGMEGRVFALFSPGHNEGFRIRFLLLREDSTYEELLSVKYLLPREQVTSIASMLVDALHRGCW